MDINEFINTIIESEPEDWVQVGRPIFLYDIHSVSGGGRHRPNLDSLGEHDVLYTLKSDLSISIAAGLPDNDRYYSEWLKNFGQETGRSSFADLMWNGRPVVRLVLVHVTNNTLVVNTKHCTLPSPDPSNLTVPKRYAAVVNLLHELAGGDLHVMTFIEAAGITVIDDRWP